MEFPSNIPDLECLQEKTRSIQTDNNPSSIRQKLEEVFKFYEIINFEVGYDFPIWRTRKCQRKDGFGNFKDLYYPPSNLTRAGRLNNPNHPVLYASFNKFTAFTEVSANPEDYLHIIGFLIKQELKLRCAVIGEVFHVHRSGGSKICDFLTKKLNNILINLDFRIGLRWIFLDAFFAGLLVDKTAESRSYIHSRILADLIFQKLPKIDAIYYPSVVLENGVNLAIKTDSADRLLQLNGTSVIQINQKFDYGIYDFSLLRNAKGVSPDGVIYWES